ncbi:MAG TPA: response regulator [Candidatus Nitrosotalea sp.]|nr:response regulator [Candidatus Nitrosotalea sp.]
MARILIADDSDAIRMVLKDIITIGKHECASEAANGLDAVEQFKQTNPDVVLLDMAMPKKDGLAVLKEITALKPKVKVIMITATDNQSIIKQCIAVGASAYILKPFNFEDVLSKIDQVLQSTD